MNCIICIANYVLHYIHFLLCIAFYTLDSIHSSHCSYIDIDLSTLCIFFMHIVLCISLYTSSLFHIINLSSYNASHFHIIDLSSYNASHIHNSLWIQLWSFCVMQFRILIYTYHARHFNLCISIYASFHMHHIIYA